MARPGRPKVDPTVRAMQAIKELPAAEAAIFQRACWDQESNEYKALAQFRVLKQAEKTIVFNLMGVEMNKPEAA